MRSSAWNKIESSDMDQNEKLVRYKIVDVTILIIYNGIIIKLHRKKNQFVSFEKHNFNSIFFENKLLRKYYFYAIAERFILFYLNRTF